MMFVIKALFALSMLVMAMSAQAQMPTACRVAYRGCDFRFANSKYLQTFSIASKPDKVFTPAIVSKMSSEMIGILNTNITVEFIFKNSAVMITKFANPNFTPYHFKPYKVKGMRKSGIGHQTFHGNQMMIAKGKCIRIYFSAYQVLDVTGNVVENMNDVPKSMNKCVVFRAAN